MNLLLMKLIVYHIDDSRVKSSNRYSIAVGRFCQVWLAWKQLPNTRRKIKSIARNFDFENATHFEQLFQLFCYFLQIDLKQKEFRLY